MSPVVKTRLSGTVVLALGIAAAVLARRLPAQAGFGLGPAFLPFWTGLIFAGCGLWLLARPGDTADGTTADLRGLGRAAAGFSILLLYVLALERLGYLLSTVGFLAGTIILLSPSHPGRALSVGFAGAVFLVLVFRVWLRVPLPGGPIGW
jgi:hypothetical protein